MREIKFRAWDKKNKKILPLWSIHWKTWDRNVVNEIAINFIEVEDDGTYELTDNTFDLMQFIGLSDKNNVEIYEGDIVLCQAYGTRWNRRTVDNMIEFRQSLVYEFGGESENPEDLKVIGNIYENPELND